ncbi:hypothetical protein N9527_00895 [Pseudomonadales bacterium]|nr:hypothetical protein [Pseudomonadales bacterium]
MLTCLYDITSIDAINIDAALMQRILQDIEHLLDLEFCLGDHVNASIFPLISSINTFKIEAISNHSISLVNSIACLVKVNFGNGIKRWHCVYPHGLADCLFYNVAATYILTQTALDLSIAPLATDYTAKDSWPWRSRKRQVLYAKLIHDVSRSLLHFRLKLHHDSQFLESEYYTTCAMTAKEITTTAGSCWVKAHWVVYGLRCFGSAVAL